MSKIILPSKAVLDITESDFATQFKLFQTCAEILKGVNLEGLKELKDIHSALDGVNVIKDAFCALVSSQAFFSALEACFPRVLYNGKKIDNMAFFDDADAKKDFISVCKEVASVNLAPFIGPLWSALNGAEGLATAKVQSIQK